MIDVSEIAKYYIHLTTEMANIGACEYMTHFKLQQLLYFTQCEYLAKFGEPLFSDTFEAWSAGPVIPAIYQQYGQFGSDPLPDDYADSLTDVVKEFLMDVDRTYGVYSATVLADLSCEKDSPWENSFVPDHVVSISNDLIKSYFTSHQKVIPFTETLKILRKKAKQLPHDADGNIVIQGSDDDPWRTKHVE